MKKVLVSILTVLTVVSCPIAASAGVGVDFNAMLSADNPYNYLLSFAPFPMPVVSGSQRVGLAFDVTNQVTLLAGLSNLSVSAGDYIGLAASSLGYSLGARMRLSTGTLSPVLGAGIDIITLSLPDMEVDFTLANLYGTVGVEWAAAPNMLVLLDIKAIEMASGSGKGGGEDVTLDNQTRILRSGTLGFRWYFM